ncbi:MAG: AAA family ATPase [Alphaproteobacteria bacterium]
MKIRALRLAQFKKFDRSSAVEGFADGLNLIAGPNETGKSTLLLALRAALFERHGSKAQAVKDFSPHHVTGARPTVTLDFEIEGEPYTFEKSFLSRPAASLQTPGGQRFQGSAAETELKHLLRLDPSEKTSADKDSPAHFGVLLTPQTRSFQQPSIEDGTRHTLEAAIAEDFSELGNQSEVDRLTAEVEGMLFELVSKRGEPKGRYKEVDTRLGAIEGELIAAMEERQALHDQLDRLAQEIEKRNELSGLARRERLSERLAELEAAQAKALHRQTLENRCLAARQVLRDLETTAKTREERREQRQRLADEVTGIDAELGKARAALTSLEQALTEREARLAQLGDDRETLAARKREVETLGRQLERRRHVEATLAALATDVRLELEADALDRVAVNGEPATEAGDRLQVTEGLLIAIEGVGRIAVEPKTEPLKEALAAKADADAKISTLLARLDLADGEPEAIEAAWQAVTADLQTLETSCAEQDTALADERRQAAESNASLKSLDDQRARLSERLAALSATDDKDDQPELDAKIAEVRQAVDAADTDLRALPQSEGPAASAEVERVRARIEERRGAIEETSKTIAGLEAAIGVRSGLGLDDKIDQLGRQRHLLTAERDAFSRDRRALSLLHSTLREAADEAKATFNAPLSARLTPYIQDLFPDATPVVTPDFSIRALDRDGREEPFLQLSDGTREQIAILARLAYADMLQARGLPALIVLDDALTFSDKDRLARVFAILEQAAKHLQIIILTCHEDRFAGLEAKRLAITPVAETTSSAA